MPRPKKPKPCPYALAKTQNGRDIQKMLVGADKDPRDYKDWVVLHGNRMVEWMGSYEVAATAPKAVTVEQPEAPPVDFGTLLVHKSKLHEFIGELAEKWWHAKLGRRVQQKGPQ